MSGAAGSARGPDRRPRRRLTDRPWTDVARGLGTLGLGIAALLFGVGNVIDESGERTSTGALDQALDRQAFEQECRFDLAQPVEELEAAQIDVLVDLAIARGAGDVEALRAGLDRLTEIREAKTEAIADRAGAVAECSRRARALFGPEP